MKRTVHGENLQYRPGGSWVGLAQKRTFRVRDAWCPRCEAKPQRKCVATLDDRESRAWAMRGKTLRWDHDERQERSRFLTKLSNENGGAILTLAVKPGATCNPRRQTMQAFDGLALFRAARGVAP